MPHLLQLFNTNVEQINSFMSWREKKQELLYLESKHRTTLSLDDPIPDKIKELREEVGALEKQSLLPGFK